MTTSADKLLSIVHDKERRVLKALIKVYGDDSSAILNGLHALAARIAIGTGVKPEDFSGGMKHHWDFIANSINDHVRQKRRAVQ